MENTTKQRRSSIKIMGKMIGLVKPLAHIMTAAVLLGTLGYLCAIFLTITAGHGVLLAMKGQRVTKYLIILVVLAVMRGILHYAEQYCNHFIAFKLLAIIRHQVFAILRKLCPAKLDGREKGNLISIITTDIELLEVFYAHTISPIMIAILTSLIMVVFIGRFHVYAGIFAVCSYLLVGCVIPLRNGKKGGQKGMEFRSGFGKLNSFVLESLRGIDETIQYGQGKKRKAQISEKSIELGKMQKDLNRMEAMQRAVTDLVILCCSFGMFFLMYHLYQAGNVTFDAMLLATIAMMGSFGPVTALSSLSNNLNQTLASGERVLSLLEEEPMVEESEGEADISFEGASVEDVTFAYDEEVILKDCNINMKQGKVIGICGKSGCGKSTLLNRLTDAGVLEEDKLFATLDPTTRVLELPGRQEILLTDTVGFIRKLPHHLIEAFKSTLEEAKYADYILHVVDASNPQHEKQMHIVYDTLYQLDIREKTVITLFNKQDAVTEREPLHDLRADHTLAVSAREGTGLDELKELLAELLRENKVLIERTIAYADAGILQQIRKQGELLEEDYRPEGIYVKAYVPLELYGKL